MAPIIREEWRDLAIIPLVAISSSISAGRLSDATQRMLPGAKTLKLSRLCKLGRLTSSISTRSFRN